MTNRQRVVVAMIDGLDPAYATPEVMPELDRLGANGLSTVVEAIAPTVTNANNAGISCAAWPSEHGITGNYYYVPATGEEDYMESAELLLRPTLMTQVADHGGKAALLTAKKKTVSLLGTKTTPAVAAEEPPAAFADRYGQPPGIYSAGINHWLWTVAVDAAPDAAFFATADHGMNYKTLVYDLNQALANRDAPVRRALSAEKDKYVRHHRTFGGTAWIWLNDPRDEGRVTDALNKLPGVESVLTRGDAAVRFHLHPDRIGDLVVLGDPNTVFGDLAPGQESEQLPSHYRSHGSLHEVPVPLVAHNNESLQYRTPPKHNKDLLTPLLTNWLPGTHHP
ncbi:alkaline phosphatase family protein [Kribbella solani]|uniref:Phosphonoacetate hydrolase n=1 Tax=Kribbella solani TaxID=236067 RepID=A0A841DMR3_9ACTN|nr:alkaline phosphatase family protein [Kribbella solani]MBB5979953.1 phosphonoacetate hydrolase [Kribbella solani]